MDRRSFVLTLAPLAAASLSGLSRLTPAEFSSGQRALSEGLDLLVEREETLAGCVRGYLSTRIIGEKKWTVAAYVLEPPEVGNLPGLSNVPAGTYPVHVRQDGKLGWRLELEGVPNREHIELHVGNYPKNTEGCLLIGSTVDANSCSVLHSADAMKALRTLFDTFGQDWMTTLTVR